MKPFYTAESFRFSNKTNNECERLNYDGWFTEQIQLFGQEVDYFVYAYTLSGHDAVYGEQPSATYASPIRLVIMAELNENSVVLSKFGIESNDDLTGYIGITTFTAAMSSVSVPLPEPKAGDVITLSEYVSDRSGNRSGKSFEVTQRLDQEISKINPLAGHYVWLLHAKRLDYTFNPGLTAEKGSNQVYDSSKSGILAGGLSPQSPAKIDTNTIDVESRKIFDYGIRNNDDVYGDYN